jgi:phytoene dehydrogenase-like protein
VLNARAIRDYLGAPEGAIYGFALEPPTRSLWFGLDRSPKTPLDGVFLASSYAGSGGYSGAMGTGAMAGDTIESWLKRQSV